MSEEGGERFNVVMREIIKKSLFTEKQVEILMQSMGLAERGFSISRGAYYRQRGQARDKLARFYYTAALLRGLGVLVPGDVDVISSLSEHVSMINRRDISPGQEHNIINVIDTIVKQACKE